MKRRKRLPIPQHEFGFYADSFNLFGDSAPDGDRLAHELSEAQAARERTAQAQVPLFAQPTTRKPQIA